MPTDEQCFTSAPGQDVEQLKESIERTRLKNTIDNKRKIQVEKFDTGYLVIFGQYQEQVRKVYATKTEAMSAIDTYLETVE